MSLSDGLSSSKGDPRVLLVLNAILSAAFVYVVLGLAALANVTEFTWLRFAVLTLLLMAATYLMTH